jgi:hypothetical protein
MLFQNVVETGNNLARYRIARRKRLNMRRKNESIFGRINMVMMTNMATMMMIATG